MRDVPELTFRGALSILGHYDRPVLDRLNTVLGGAVMVGGAVALTGPVAAPAVALAAIWAWVDQKNEAIGLVRTLLARISEHRAAARGFDRTRLIAAAHTVLVVNSVVRVFRRTVGEKVFTSLEITDKELATLLAGTSDRGISEVVYDSPVPIPSSGRGFAENLLDVQEWQLRFASALVRFCGGLGAGQAVRGLDAAGLAEEALDLYRSQYRRLAAQVPEFLVWTLLNEFGAAHNLVERAHVDVRRALDVQVRAMSRLESLLTAVSGAVPDHVSALHRAARAGLDEPVVTRDAAAMSVLADIRFPLVHEIFVQPDYRVERMGPGCRVADEHWWERVRRHGDLDLRLATHLTSPEATRLPLLVLGHPGAGKSLLMKVLAARLPADQYTTVYAPLRHVSSTAPVYEQVEQALKRETNGRVDWPGLAQQSNGTTLVVLLDGLDEMLQATDRDRADYLHDVAEFQWREAAQGRPVVALVTSRTLVADRVEIPAGTTVVKLEEFDPEQIEQWRRVWNSVNQAAIDVGRVRELTREAVARQQDLARQPLLLLMLAVYSAEPSFPAIESGLSKTALYRTLFDNFTRREATKLPRATPPEEQFERLSVAALGMFNRGRQHVTDAELAADMAVLAPNGALLADPEQRLVAQFFFVHTAEADLGDRRARRSYEFLHATFGEYLVAREVVDTLIDTADSTVGRRGEREPDDDRLFALLSHDCVAVRGPILDFLADLLADLSVGDQERVTQTVVVLLAGARRRQGSARYAEYRPTGTDHLRAIAAYTANLVLLAILANPWKSFPLARLPLQDWSWGTMLDLWRAGLNTDSRHAVLAAIDREHDVLRLSGERTRATGPDAELRHAELAHDHALARTLRIGRTMCEVFESRLEAAALTAEHEELLGQLVAILAFHRPSQDRPLRVERMAELLAETGRPDYLLRVICMVLKQQALVLPRDMVRVLVAYLLDRDCRDTYALIAAAGAHPELVDDFPQLLDADRYAGRHGTELMLQGTIGERGTERFRPLLEALPPTEDLREAVWELLGAFEWRIEP